MPDERAFALAHETQRNVRVLRLGPNKCLGFTPTLAAHRSIGRANCDGATTASTVGGLHRNREARAVEFNGGAAGLEDMITVGVIRNGATYLSHHLRKNDYWSEGEKAVQGEWIGQAATALGLAGQVTDAPFEALRLNRHPQTGEPLTQRLVKDRVAFSTCSFPRRKT